MNLRSIAVFSIVVILFGCGNEAKKSDEKKASEQKSEKQKASTKTILFFGNSLTAGYGLDEPAEQAFPAIIQEKIDSLNLGYKVVNAGLSGETSAGGNARIEWLLKQQIDVFVLELGANDGLRGIQPAETEKNLQSIVDKVKAKYPDCKLILTGMMVPPNLGQDYADKFKAVFPKLAQKNNMAFVPFLLENVAGEKALNQRDGIHPTAEGAKIVAENVWKVLRGEL